MEQTDFDSFWSAYPRKQAKGDARKAWKQTESIRPPMDELLASIKAACRSEQWLRDEGRFIPYPASWLRGERWADEHHITLAPRLPVAKLPPLQKPPTPDEVQRARELIQAAKMRRVA